MDASLGLQTCLHQCNIFGGHRPLSLTWNKKLHMRLGIEDFQGSRRPTVRVRPQLLTVVRAYADDEEDEIPVLSSKDWFSEKPTGFGHGKEYDVSLEERLMQEIELSRKANAALAGGRNGTKGLKDQNKNRENSPEFSPDAVEVWIGKLPKKKNADRDLNKAFKNVQGLMCIQPAVLGNSKTREPICKGYATATFADRKHAERFVEEFRDGTILFGKVEKKLDYRILTKSMETIHNPTIGNDSRKVSGPLPDPLPSREQNDPESDKELAALGMKLRHKVVTEGTNDLPVKNSMHMIQNTEYISNYSVECSNSVKYENIELGSASGDFHDQNIQAVINAENFDAEGNVVTINAENLKERFFSDVEDLYQELSVLSADLNNEETGFLRGSFENDQTGNEIQDAESIARDAKMENEKNGFTDDLKKQISSLEREVIYLSKKSIEEPEKQIMEMNKDKPRLQLNELVLSRTEAMTTTTKKTQTPPSSKKHAKKRMKSSKAQTTIIPGSTARLKKKEKGFLIGALLKYGKQ